MRGFNFIEDYGRALYCARKITNFEILQAVAGLSTTEEQYADTFDNHDYEMKRFISWFYSAYTDQYDELLETDKSGFLKKCAALYDPKLGTVESPANCYDFRPVYPE